MLDEVNILQCSHDAMTCKEKTSRGLPRFMFCQIASHWTAQRDHYLTQTVREPSLCHYIASFLDVALPVDYTEENPEAVLDGEVGEDAEDKLGATSKIMAPSKSTIGRVFST